MEEERPDTQIGSGVDATTKYDGSSAIPVHCWIAKDDNEAATSRHCQLLGGKSGSHFFNCEKIESFKLLILSIHRYLARIRVRG